MIQLASARTTVTCKPADGLAIDRSLSRRWPANPVAWEHGWLMASMYTPSRNVVLINPFIPPELPTVGGQLTSGRYKSALSGKDWVD
jgi:hypothetical protein